MDDMTAKEMFEAIGFEQTICDENYIIYRRDHALGDWEEIIFDFEYRVVDTDKNSVSSVGINDYILKAINKQFEELGWLCGSIIEFIENGKMKRVCSYCNDDITELTKWMSPKYCPNCGTKINEIKRYTS